MSYCAGEDAMRYLRVYLADLTDSAMLGSEAQVRMLVDGFLPVTKAAINRACQRDFEHHDGEAVIIDGDGVSDTLFLGARGMKPIISVASITENDDTMDADDYTYAGDYAERGEIRKIDTSGYESGGAWDAGVRNITVTLTYGYATDAEVPIEIREAQATLIAARILGQCAGAGSGGVKSVSIGAFSVSYGKDHGYAMAIETWLQDIARVCKYHRPVELLGAD